MYQKENYAALASVLKDGKYNSCHSKQFVKKELQLSLTVLWFNQHS